MSPKRVCLAMSGGVDSAAAALLLRQQGYEVHGVTLRLRSGDDRSGLCGSEDDITLAQKLAASMGIEHTVLDLCQLFRDTVMKHFTDEYVRGRTPNPCVDCNREIKFGALMDWALDHGMDAMATGHYARVEYHGETGRWRLLRGLDRRKDQTYFLFQLTQSQLSRLLLPVGGYEKSDIRTLAAEHGLENAQKPDSQDICFVPDGDYAAFVERQGGTLRPGNFVDESGRVLGAHRGLERYTTGQRKGLGVSAGAPVYVLRKDLESGDVVLGPDSALYTRTLTAERVNWISIPELTEPMAVTAKTRYSQREAAATVEPLPGGRIRMVFTEPQRAVTPGQAVVFYDGDLVLGGGTICP